MEFKCLSTLVQPPLTIKTAAHVISSFFSPDLEILFIDMAARRLSRPVVERLLAEELATVGAPCRDP
jgi:hypothetical protein